MAWSEWKKFGGLENITMTYANCGKYRSDNINYFPINQNIVIPEKCTEMLILCCFAQTLGGSTYPTNINNYTASGAITQSEIISQPTAGNLSNSIIKCKVTPNETISFTLKSKQSPSGYYVYGIPIAFLFL